MTLRKQGTCKDCNKPLYGDDYGAAGHACEKYESREDKLLRLLKEAYHNGIDEYWGQDSPEGISWHREVEQILKEA